MTMFDSQEAWRLIPDSDPTAECESVSGSAAGGIPMQVKRIRVVKSANLGGEDAIAWAQA